MRCIDRACCFAIVAALFAAGHGEIAIKMATTTSTENSGLLEILLPAFTQETGIRVHVIAVGTGRALKLGENGDVDLVFVHARTAEEEFVKNGFGVDRRDVMYNDFVILGPASDPAGLSGDTSATSAFRKIAKGPVAFISRGDESGTHLKEKEIWKACGIDPVTVGRRYIQAGQGMEAVLVMANEKQAYALSDRGTFIAFEDRLGLKILSQGDGILFNPYGIIAVSPARHPHVKSAETGRFIDWITSLPGQRRIAGFARNGKQPFFPNGMGAVIP